MELQTAPTRPISSMATLRVREVKGDVIIAEVPGTEYQLHLLGTPAPFGSEPQGRRLRAGRIGQRIKGEIHAKALRMHRSDTGGWFIEPIYGAPRIVQGEVISIDGPSRRVLMQMAVPIWVSVHPEQDLGAIQVGELWNCYVESGTWFVVGE